MRASFFYALRRYRFSMVGWGLALFALALTVVQAYSVVQDQGEVIQDLLKGLPKELLAFAKMDPSEAISAKTVMDARFFLLMPIILGVFAALAGSGMLVQDEESGRLDLILAYPVSRRNLFFARLAAIVIVLVGILAFGWAGLTVGIYWAAINISPLSLLLPFCSLFAVVILTASLGLLFSMVFPARRIAGMMAGFLIVASFFLNGLAELNESLLPIARLLPLHYYQGLAAIDDFNLIYFLGLMAASVLCIVVAYWRFEARDIRVAGEGVFAWRRFAIGAAVVLALVAVPIGISMQPTTYPTPNAVFDTAMTSLENEDWDTLALCLTDESIEDWNAVLVAFGSVFQTQGQALVKNPGALPGNAKLSIDQIMTVFSMYGKYKSAMKLVDNDKLKDRTQECFGLLLSARSGKAFVSISDSQRKLARLVKKQDKFFTKAMQAWAVVHHYPKRPKIEKLNIAGNTASADLVFADDSRVPISFENANGSWRIQLPFLPGEKRELLQTPKPPNHR